MNIPIGRLLLPLTLLAAGLPPAAMAAGELVTVYKSPTCNCCKKWAQHMREQGFRVESRELDDLRMVKAMSGIKPAYASCHTAQVGGYVIEGHVPAEDVRRLLAEHPDDIQGLAAPGMPAGAPGMEGPRRDHYRVVSFDERGNTRVFAEH